MRRIGSSRAFGWARVLALVCGTTGSAAAQLYPTDPISHEPAGAWVVYEARGGLLGTEDLLVIDDAGYARVSHFNVMDGRRTTEGQLSRREISLLDSLFVAADFEAMPARFWPEGIIIDGVTFRVTYARDGAAHTVESETAADEPAGYTRIRQELEGILNDLLAKPILTVKSEGGIVGAREHLEVKASGAWDYRYEIPGQPGSAASASGRFPAAMIERLRIAAESEGLMSLPVCLDSADAVDAIRYEVTYASASASHTVHFTDASAEIPAVLVAIRMGFNRLSQQLR
jgi:hypothetical protein